MSEPAPTDPAPIDPSITPIPLSSEGVGSVILFGGTFDPITLAHTQMATDARALAEPDAWLLFIPAARSPHKPDAPLASDADRIAMLRLATADIDRCTTWTDEIDRAHAGEPSYSIHTIERARQVLDPTTRLRLLIGADQALTFHHWRDPKRILELAPPIVMPRNGVPDQSTLIAALRQTRAWSDPQLQQWGTSLLIMPQTQASATDARTLLAKGDFDALTSLVNPRVLTHIRTRRIYPTP